MSAMEESLVRYAEEYKWEWKLIAKIINYKFNTECSAKELQDMYGELITPSGCAEDNSRTISDGAL